jgi:hypothetical protein
MTNGKRPYRLEKRARFEDWWNWYGTYGSREAAVAATKYTRGKYRIINNETHTVEELTEEA